MNKKLDYQVCGKFFTKKWMTSHIEREHQPNVLEKPSNNNNNKVDLREKRNNDKNFSVSTHEKKRKGYYWPKQRWQNLIYVENTRKNRYQKTYS